LNILVTGGEGFIGSALVERLIGEGHDVSILDITSPHPLYHGNITNKWDVDKALDGIEVVYHLAGASNIDKVKDSPLQTIASNIMGTANLLHFSVLHNMKRFIFVSTVYVYDTHGHLYTTTKRCGESLTKDFHTLYNLPYTILRLGTVYGEKSRDEDVVSIFAQRALKGLPIIVHGDGSQQRHFIHISDVIDALISCLSLEYENATALACALKPSTILDLARIVQNAVGQKLAIQIDPAKARGDDYGGKILDEPNCNHFCPRIPMEEGVIKTLEWYRGNP